MSPDLKVFLLEIRGHPLFNQLVKQIAPPSTVRFKRRDKMTVEQFGAEAIFVSGQQDQHTKWLELLTGVSSQSEGVDL